MTTAFRWTTKDLETLPEIEGTRYEIIDGELHVAKQLHWDHQFAASRIFRFLDEWNEQTGLGVANSAPGIIFSDDNNVIPDVVWISKERLAASLDAAGHILVAPEIAIEVLSFGWSNEHRDREAKPELYSRYGVQEYWIINWRQRQVEICRREKDTLTLVETLAEQDTLTSPLLPGFACSVGRLFVGAS